MENNIVSKEAKPHGWIIKTKDGKEWSVVDFDSQMKSSVAYKELKEAGVYMGWEAYDGKECYRGTEEELLKGIEEGTLTNE